MSAIQSLFPLDGPHSRESVTAAARSVGELVRYLNHATQEVELTPPELAQVVAELGRAVGMLPQLLSQLGGQVRQVRDHPRLGCDTGTPAAGVGFANWAILHLDEAFGHTRRAGAELQYARNDLSHLYLREDV